MGKPMYPATLEDYFDDNMERVDDPEKAAYLKLTFYDAVGELVRTKFIKVGGKDVLRDTRKS